MEGLLGEREFGGVWIGGGSESSGCWIIICLFGGCQFGEGF